MTPSFGPHHQRDGEGGNGRQGEVVFPILATGVVVFAASAAVTYVNIGFRVDFVRRWLSAYIVGGRSPR